jgi:hypothetical protein
MPSELKQLNVRLMPDDEARLERLLPLVRSAHPGMPVTLSTVVRQGLIALERALAEPKGGKKK